jgi:hypothetical protein
MLAKLTVIFESLAIMHTAEKHKGDLTSRSQVALLEINMQRHSG